MKKAKRTPIDYSRFCEAHKRDRISLRVFRENRVAAVQLFAGNRWSEMGSEKDQPLNLLALWVRTVRRLLVSQFPQMMFSTDQREQKPAVAALQTWANREVKEMGLAKEINRATLDAMFTLGIMKVGLATPADASMAGWNMTAGTPFAKAIDFDDFSYDVHARDFDEVEYIGHRFRPRAEVIMDSILYGKERKDLTISTDNPYNLEGDLRVNTLGRGPYTYDSQEAFDRVDLWEFYFPHEKLIVTFANDDLTGASVGKNLKPLREVEWVGPDTGPYIDLGFDLVPGNAMPKAPIQDQIWFHESVNGMLRKLDRQAHDTKEILPVSTGRLEDGTRAIRTNDGEAFQCDNPGELKPLVFRTPMPALVQLGVHFKDLFSYQAGNMDMYGGLAPQAKTLGQDQMLAQNASGLITDMQATEVGFVERVARSLAWYWWHDPFKVMKTTHSLPSVPDMQIVRRLFPGNHPDPTALRRMGKFSDLRLEVNPYSMQHQTPQQRLAALWSIVEKTGPMMGLMQQQGMMLNIKYLLQKTAEYGDMPDLEELYTISGMTQQDSQDSNSGGTPTGPPASTERTYTRRSLGGDTPQNREAAMMNNVNGKQNQNGQTQMPMGA